MCISTWQWTRKSPRRWYSFDPLYVLDPKAVYGDDFPGETFRVLKENEIKKYSQYRTQELVMKYYREMDQQHVDAAEPLTVMANR
jgi:formylglycine-generating enzyme required for sulfatase activity